MTADEQAIRGLVASLHRTSAAGDISSVRADWLRVPGLLVLELPRFRGRLRAEVLSHFGVSRNRVVHRRRGACYADADGGQPAFDTQV